MKHSLFGISSNLGTWSVNRSPLTSSSARLASFPGLLSRFLQFWRRKKARERTRLQLSSSWVPATCTLHFALVHFDVVSSSDQSTNQLAVLVWMVLSVFHQASSVMKSSNLVQHFLLIPWKGKPAVA